MDGRSGLLADLLHGVGICEFDLESEHVGALGERSDRLVVVEVADDLIADDGSRRTVRRRIRDD